ncbi:cyclin N-terminal domain-containing protein 1 [Denticeps clupeoides]|uniref:cyclin N-terminal domain-containing protein 1 n=1 Tax=Denticeps clupeoides TaxID=299321 RepID=UPI0010A33B52|nr:cyclin N-terminal domain-containing protein 1 [Denticeps clupeoides]XP_028845402.1 cyclin N-terminal domain-containing protein 1 [Denticeps clupeoides]
METRFPKNLRFGEVAFEFLSEFLHDLNAQNKQRVEEESRRGGEFQHAKVVEFIFHACEELQLDPAVGYHAAEILERFMGKHLDNMFCSLNAQGGNKGNSEEEAIVRNLAEKFSLMVFSCVQIASKLTLHCNIVDNNAAMRFLHSLGHTCTSQTLVDLEMLILKTLDFRLSLSSPLTYVETLLEVLGHNDSSVPVAQLHELSCSVLLFIHLQRTSIYQCLLQTVTGCSNLAEEHRDRFVSVTKDCMLLGVGVIAVAAFILNFPTWEQVVQELGLITGISGQSIMEFAFVTLIHVTSHSTSRTLLPAVLFS